jgi:hypothetical protein
VSAGVWPILASGNSPFSVEIIRLSGGGNFAADGNDALNDALNHALKRDFRHQLTVVGQFAQAIVSEKVKGSRVTTQTDKPSVEVSWQVTGIRQDAWAEKNRIANTVDKVGAEKGTLLHPEAFGRPAEGAQLPASPAAAPIQGALPARGSR